MANYPQLDDQVGVWKLKDVNSAVMGGYWRTVGSRALSMGGNEANTIDFITMASTGNATDFGDMLLGSDGSFETSSGFAGWTRALGLAGASPSNKLEYVTIASQGNVADFGDATAGTFFRAGTSNSTRGLMAGGDGSPADINVIDYVSLASTGNAIDFGNLTVVRRAHNTMPSSSTRALFMGGQNPASQDVIDFVEIATTGNAVDFGNLTSARGSAGGAGSSTIGLHLNGYTDGATALVDRVVIASQGNAVDFGDMTVARFKSSSTSNSVRAFASGGNTPTAQNVIDSISISTGGNGVDFGDLTVARGNHCFVSEAHGGLNEGYQGTRIRPIPQGGGAGQRGLQAAGESPATSNIDFITISTLGNASKFGDLAATAFDGINCIGGEVRAIFGGGAQGPVGFSDTMQYVEFASEGNAADFGN